MFYKKVCMGLRFLLVITVLVSSIAGCKKKNDETQNQSHIVVITSLDNPPFETMDSATQEPQGFDIDLIRHIAERAKWQITIRDQEFHTLVPSLQGKKADLAIAWITPTEERRRVVDFSRSYAVADSALLVSPEKGEVYSWQAWLPGKMVGAQIGSTQAEIAKTLQKKFPGLEITLYNKLTEAFAALRNRRVDGVLIPDSTGRAFVQQDQKFRLIDLGGVFRQEQAIAFPKGSPYKEKVDGILDALEKEGILDKLQQKWLGNKD